MASPLKMMIFFWAPLFVVCCFAVVQALRVFKRWVQAFPRGRAVAAALRLFEKADIIKAAEEEAKEKEKKEKKKKRALRRQLDAHFSSPPRGGSRLGDGPNLWLPSPGCGPSRCLVREAPVLPDNEFYVIIF
ncbi:hypothetical protein PG985_013128 [Apiospora marii]|uniref:uncharacterized protein n=1 Tax=Apiospora marii TaxID=335849 RepID=UPI003130A831